MKSYTGDTPTDLYYICKDGNWGWYLDAAGTEALKEPELVYLTMHIKPETKWSKPAMQHWNDKLTITDTKGQETITGWDVKGDLFTAEENGFYKLTVKGTFGGFQFVDVDNADDTKTGDNTYDKLLDKFVAETPTDVYYIQKDGTGTGIWIKMEQLHLLPQRGIGPGSRQCRWNYHIHGCCRKRKR